MVDCLGCQLLHYLLWSLAKFRHENGSNINNNKITSTTTVMMVDIIFREYINGSDSKKIIMIMTIKTTIIKQHRMRTNDF